MKRLFLSSYFTEVASLFQKEIGFDLAGKTVTFIPTAANPEKVRFYVGSDKKALAKLGLTVEELDISRADGEEIKSTIARNDLIFVSGGNTFYLLREMKKSGAGEAIVKAIKAGKPYIGSSAGSVVASPDIAYIALMDSPDAAPGLEDTAGLSVIGFSPLPHFTNAPFKKIAEKTLSRFGDLHDLKPISNHELIIADGETYRIESAR